MVVDDVMLSALGRVAVNFQSLELFVGVLTSRLISSDNSVGKVIVANLSFGKLCDVCISLFRYRSQDVPLLDELKELVKQASLLEQERNTLMHSSWGTSEEVEGSGMFRLKSITKRKHGLKVELKQTDPGEVNQVAADLEKLSIAVAAFIRKGIRKNILG